MAGTWHRHTRRTHSLRQGKAGKGKSSTVQDAEGARTKTWEASAVWEWCRAGARRARTGDREYSRQTRRRRSNKWRKHCRSHRS
eukprot:scaffold113534_cov53-Phaeocystis_antarctica.AAC.2